ncbi:hypothetical protein AVEN_272150-1 [Araneus ventricosus]|uniref:Uncharacterized protein n=1 Tax=Araneus ventricosus TaxID=182803 RepID=A0A4Y2VQG9_ARAVE|nr:hypothetical protein AVEN_272150-1 [Araneus ventricosus]
MQKKLQEAFKRRQQEFLSNLDNIFDIAKLMQRFLQRQREPDRLGRLSGVVKELTDKEERTRLRVVKEENRRIKYVSASKSSASYEPLHKNIPLRILVKI